MALNLDYDHEWKPDAPKSAGPNLDFDPDWKPAPAPKGGLVASAKQAIGSTIKGAGQAAADFLPGVGQENALKTYGQSVVDANPTAVHSLADLKANPLTGVAEATGNAGGSMGAMLGARALGTGITAAAPFTGPAAPLVAGIGQGIAWLGPMAAAALPSFGGIREKQIQDDPTRQDSIGAKALAAAGAGTVGLIESKFGPQEWALSAMSKEGRGQLAEKFAAKTLGGSVAKGAAKGAAIEGAEEIAQNPIEQIASYQNPLTADNLKDTAFSGVMGALGGGVLGGASGAAFRKGAENKPAATPEVAPADQPIPYAPTTVEEVAKQRADAMGVKPENGPISAAASLAIEGQTAEEMRLATPGILAQGAAAAEQARLAQEARQAAEPGIPYEPVAVEAPQAAPIVPTVPMVDPQIPAQDWINQQTGVDQSSGVTRRDFEAAAKEQADPQTILDESGRPKTTTSALEIQQFHADFDRREALRQRNLSAAERLRAARGGKPLVEGAQPADVAPQPSAPVVDIAQPDIADEAPARIARPAPSPASGGSSAPAMPSVSSLISQGATLQGKNLVDASNNVVLPNLNIQQYREANTLLKSKPNAKAAETPAPAIPVQAAPQGPKQQSAGVANPVIKESLTTQTPATIKPDLTVQTPATGKQSLQVQAPAATEESSVVQPENSNGNARPASETVPPVSPEQGGVNAGGVGNLRADRGSGTGGQAVRNDAAEPAASVPDSRAGGSGERVAKKPKPAKQEGSGLDRAVRVLMDRTDGNGSPDGLIGPENQDARAEIISALTGKPAESLSLLEKSVGAMEHHLHRAAGITEGSVKEKRSQFIDWIDKQDHGKPIKEKADPKQEQPAQKESPASVSTESSPARSAPSEEALIDIGLLRDRGDRWQYKFSIGSGWMTANIKSDAVDRATTTYFSTPENERLTRKERAERADNELIAHMEKTYGNMSISNLDAKYRSLGGAISDLHRAGAKEFNGNGRRSTSSAVSNEAARGAGTEKLHLGIYIKHRQSLIDEESAKSPANQNPIKAETRASTGPETESASANQETVKPSPALESLFADLDSSTVRKANKAKKAAKLHPQAAEIDYVQNNYHDILIQLMDAGKLEVNGSKSVTEENKSCL